MFRAIGVSKNVTGTARPGEEVEKPPSWQRPCGIPNHNLDTNAASNRPSFLSSINISYILYYIPEYDFILKTKNNDLLMRNKTKKKEEKMKKGIGGYTMDDNEENSGSRFHVVSYM